MKRIITLLSAAILTCSSYAQTVIWSQDFESTADSSLPTGWSQVSTNTGGAWKTGTNTFLQSSPDFPIDAHTKMVGVNDDKQGQTSATSDNSNDLLKTSSINLSTAVNPYLKFDLYYFAGTYNSVSETLKLEVSTNGGTSWTVLSTLPANTSGWETKYFSLSAYAGQSNVIIGFRYGDGGDWLYGAAMDNISVFTPAANDLNFSVITPVTGSAQAYGVASSNVTLGGTVMNLGSTAVTSFTARYQQGANPVVTNTITGVNIAPFTSYNFSYTTPYTVPGVGSYPITAWVELTGDINPLNDTMRTTIVGAAFMPTKKLLVEEATGTWCGWCPRGAVYMDSLFRNHPANVSLIAVHNADPMVVSAYDTWMGTQISGYPSVVVDRREVKDPSELIDVYNAENGLFGYANITLGTATISGTSYSLPVTVRPAVDLSGTYKLALVLCERHLKGSTTAWDQHDYYSTQSNNLPLVGAGHNWQTEPNPVLAANMEYDFVSRGIFPSVNGAAGSLPATMTNNTDYNYTITGTTSSTWNMNQVYPVVMMIRSSDGAVLNTANKMPDPAAVAEIPAGVENMQLFPNPTRDVANVVFNLKANSDVTIKVVDGFGKIVYSNRTHMNAGVQQAVVSTANLASGVYFLSVQTETGNSTQKLTVIK